MLWFGASIHRADGPEQRFASAVIVGDQSAVARRVYCKDFDIPGGAAAIDVYLKGQIAYRLLQPHPQHATKLCRDQTGQCDTGQFLDRAIAADLVVALGRLQIITVCVISDRPIEVASAPEGKDQPQLWVGQVIDPRHRVGLKQVPAASPVRLARPSFLRGVDAGKDYRTRERYCRRLSAHVGVADRLWRFWLGDIHQTQATRQAGGSGQPYPIHGEPDDLCQGFARQSPPSAILVGLGKDETRLKSGSAKAGFGGNMREGGRHLQCRCKHAHDPLKRKDTNMDQ